MDAPSEPDRPDLSLLLPRSIYFQIVHTLRGLLPPVTDTPEDLAHRDRAAIAHVASLLPANAAEANLASQHVAANAQAMECMRRSRDTPASDLPSFLKCNAQATSMMRQSQGALRLLLRIQSERRKREADAANADRAAWTEHCAAGLMAQAIPGTPAMAPIDPPSPPPAPAPSPAEEPTADPGPATGLDPVSAEAETYAVIYPRRAALIRRLGRVPDNVSFGPPDDDLVHALVTGRSPALLALDQEAADPITA